MLGLGPDRNGQLPGFLFMLSGLQPGRAVHGAIDYSTFGASGGVITTIPPGNSPPHVFAVEVGGLHDHPFPADQLAACFGTHLGPSTAQPKVDFVTPVEVLTAALAALHATPVAE